MRTVTLELPEDLAERLESMPEGERNHFAVAAFRDKLGDWEENGYEPDEAEKAEIIGHNAGRKSRPMPGADPPEPPLKTYAVRLSARANREALLIYAALEERTGDEAAAAQWYAGFLDAIGGLATLPHRFPVQADESKKIGIAVRRFLYRGPRAGAGHHVYYSIHEDSPDGPLVLVRHVRAATARPMTAKEGKEIVRED
jgi:plasmid stabilization system protein ParE